jgi:hypothetical protein
LVRHCFYSEASAHKGRPSGFDRKLLHERLLQSLQDHIGKFDLTMILDDMEPEAAKSLHFVEDHTLRSTYAKAGLTYEVHRAKGGCEKAAFLNSLEFVARAAWPQQDVVVFLEDDYAVAQDWLTLVPEGLRFGDYVTLYDHPDKYSHLYPSLYSKMYMGELSHWRTTPSTTNSYACGVRMLIEDMNTHRSYSEGWGVTQDHAKFLQLWSLGRSLVSCVPGAWSHEEVGMQCSKWF